MHQRRVKLMNEYGVDWPLWNRDGLAAEEDWPVPPALEGRIRAWADTFNVHFDHEHGWDDEERRRRHRAEGLELHRLLSAALGPEVEVGLSLWESDAHGSGELLTGPRGRRLCLELAVAGDEQLYSDVSTAAWLFDPDQGASYQPLTMQWVDPVPSEPPAPVPGSPAAVARDAAIHRLATKLSALGGVDPTETDLATALADSIAWARYWQEPDGTDVLAAQPLIRAALIPIADRIMQTPLARSWSSPRDPVQWAIDWRSPDDPAPLQRSPRETLSRWSADTREEEARAAVERPRDPTANWSGTWWSIPMRLLRTVGQVPLGFDLVEDSLGYEEATAIPVRGAGKTYEIRTEHDWTWLCQNYPMEVTASRRHDWYRTIGRDGRWLIPDWEKVAADWDAIHLTTLGYLRAATRELPLDGEGATVLAGFDPDTTLWLTDVAREIAVDPEDGIVAESATGVRQHWRRKESGDNSGPWEPLV